MWNTPFFFEGLVRISKFLLTETISLAGLMDKNSKSTIYVWINFNSLVFPWIFTDESQKTNQIF